MKSIKVSEGKSMTPSHPSAWMAQPINFDRIGRDLRHMIDQLSSSLWHNPFGHLGMLGNCNGFHIHSLVPFPEINLSETETSVEITAELPGMVEKDIELIFSNGFLTIKGSKDEKEDKEEADYHLYERRFGSFERMVMVPEGIDTNAISASLAQGILTITLPKTPEAQSSQKKITITSEKPTPDKASPDKSEKNEGKLKS